MNLTPARSRMLLLCYSRSEKDSTFHWGDVQTDFYRSAVPAHLEWYRFVRVADALVAGGYLAGSPGDDEGALTAQGLTWCEAHR